MVKLEITIAGDRFHLGKGQMIIMPANRPHALKALTKFKMMLTMIHTDNDFSRGRYRRSIAEYRIRDINGLVENRYHYHSSCKFSRV